MSLLSLSMTFQEHFRGSLTQKQTIYLIVFINSGIEFYLLIFSESNIIKQRKSSVLYVKFQIQNPAKYADFQLLYDHMVEVRQPGFEFKEEDEDIDWDNVPEEEFSDFIAELAEDPEVKRYKELVPTYVDQYLVSYTNFDGDQAGAYGFDIPGIFNYLEFTFEVDMNKLEKLGPDMGIVEFSTGNFPYGGMERFLIVLRAFGLTPVECFNGFTVYEFKWTSDFTHEAIDLPEKTASYLKKFED